MAIDGLGQTNIGNAYKTQEQTKVVEAPAKQAVNNASLQDTVEISSEAKALLSSEVDETGTLTPLSAGGTTLPPLPVKK